ncbi:TRAP transporter small permease [Maritalea porphyrae]|jgi:TRAP-type C4-dicarboxylate transport system permease small subunit|uniref:TRAP transporter small permease n=1 Tax=Maritalea porphyrae TaxID=880732 RepID=UPI0022AFBA32|nr:TRAP transporter small permease subunit [Maritalea porphyrae]MCZ4271780.1 TRAP transporter small permease subunit [Maritalea porphyrae]
MKSALNFIRRLSQLPLLVASLVLFLLMAMTFADVILRSTFNAPIEAATELTRMFMAIIVFLIMPIISGTQEHIVVDLADPLFTNKWAIRIRDTIVNLSCGAMLLWPARQVVVLAERARDYGDVTEYLAIPQFYIGWFIAIMTFVSAFVLLARGLITLFAPQLLEEQND